jgi:phage replication O-like protein O
MRVLIPNSTQIPDILLDLWMAELSGSEFKVLLYIARRTYGFGKEWDTISLNQISNGIKKRDGTILDYGTGVSRASVIRALNTLESKSIIIRQTNQRGDSREYEENTYSINLAWEQPQKKSGNGSGGGNGGGQELRRNSPRGVVSKRDYLVSKRDQVDSKHDQAWSQNETRVVSKLDPQETDLQETATRAESMSDHADAALIERLVNEGVGRSVAIDLARKKPKVCELQLEYLPFAEIRKSKGAWLASAIRNEYGPPEKYQKEQVRIRLQAISQKPNHRPESQQKDNKVLWARQAMQGYPKRILKR